MSYDHIMIYHIGIIDFLQEYTIVKKAETLLKTKIYLNPAVLISCVPPAMYRQRFVNFIVKKVLSPHRVEAYKPEDDDMIFDSEQFENQMKSVGYSIL